MLKSRIGVNAPMIMLGSSEVYGEGEGLDEDELETFRANLSKTLVSCPAGGIKDGTIVEVEDFSQNMAFKILVQHKGNDEFEKEKSADRFALGGDQPISKADDPAAALLPAAATSAASAAGDDDIVVMDGASAAAADAAAQAADGKKRGRELDGSAAPGGDAAKRHKADDAVVELD